MQQLRQSKERAEAELAACKASSGEVEVLRGQVEVLRGQVEELTGFLQLAKSSAEAATGARDGTSCCCLNNWCCLMLLLGLNDAAWADCLMLTGAD